MYNIQLEDKLTHRLGGKSFLKMELCEKKIRFKIISFLFKIYLKQLNQIMNIPTHFM